MKNVSHGTMQEKKLEGMVQVKKNEKMADAINDYILDNDFLMRFITDNVREKIYVERTYSVSMIESILINDLYDNTDSYIIGYILDEIDIYTLIDKIDNLHRDDFIRLAQQCNN